MHEPVIEAGGRRCYPGRAMINERRHASDVFSNSQKTVVSNLLLQGRKGTFGKFSGSQRTEHDKTGPKKDASALAGLVYEVEAGSCEALAPQPLSRP